jgi:aerobic-type carbon monoxide dehydrogenase small subunit (CoxS/CutS family)
MDSTLTFTVNGQARTVTTDPARPLLDVLREELQLTGTKYGCGEGRCGACTVLLDGKRTFSCRTEAEDAAGKSITTIEGLAEGDKLHPVQEAFLEESASQCGYCTPGMIMATVALLKEKPGAGDDEIVRWMNANLCRCCNYVNIFNAVKRAAGVSAAGGGRQAP